MEHYLKIEFNESYKAKYEEKQTSFLRVRLVFHKHINPYSTIFSYVVEVNPRIQMQY